MYKTMRALTILALALLGGFAGAPRAMALDLVVTSTADDGSARTLRAAIEEINAEPEGSGPHSIGFQLPSAAEPVIRPLSPLPAVVRTTVIDGLDDDGRIGVELDGSAVAESANGLQLFAVGSEAIGLSVYGFGRYGVALAGSSLRASRVGTNRDGTQQSQNGEGGVLADAQSTIGGPNGTVLPCTGDCNVIGPNRRDGVYVAGSGVTILNNHIGISGDGSESLPHGRYGVQIPSTFGAPISNVTIGGPTTPNVIANTGADGVGFVNSFGGALAARVRVSGNLIFNYAQASSRPDAQPIGLGSDGVLLNDAGDTDTGPNGWLNTPHLVSATVDTGACEFVVEGYVRAGQTVEFFVAVDSAAARAGTLRFVATRQEGSADDSDAATGTYDDPTSGTDTANRFSFRVPLDVPLTATRLNSVAIDANGNTSTVSASIVVTGAEEDSDNDGLSDIAECAIGTAPTEEDSDGDGLPDGEEVPELGVDVPNTDGDHLINPLDPDDDGDRIDTAVELLFGTSEQLDVDGDGLPAYLDLDSDNDGVSDAIEWAQDGAESLDTDGDGLVNVLDSDSDGDGLCDGDRGDDSNGCVRGEDLNVDGVTGPAETGSRLADTDADGICDGSGGAEGCVAGPDNCPLVANVDQIDADSDGRGDACTCGDGRVSGDETCDDGNVAAGDGCSAQCQVEPGATCDEAAPSTCTCVVDCATVCFSDEDGDGFTGTPRSIALSASCADFSTPDIRWSESDEGDCADNDAEVFPGALEYCDGRDTDCDGLVGGDDPDIRDASVVGVGGLSAFVDDDADTCGDAGKPVTVCGYEEAGVSANSNDLNDSDGVCCGNGRLETGEVCDGAHFVDASCPEGLVGTPVCNNVFTNNPNYDETCTVDEQPSGCATPRSCYSDDDGDGYAGTEQVIPSTQQCSEFRSGPGNTAWQEVSADCLDDPSDDCSVLSYPGAAEVCDGCDNDCDDSTADGAEESALGMSCDGADSDPCANGAWACTGGTMSCQETSGAALFYADTDADGCGDLSAPFDGCVAPGETPDGHVSNSDDDDDTDGVCCGNGVIEDVEECEQGETTACSAIGEFGSASTECADDCTWDRQVCVVSDLCGNGQIDGDEVCDGGPDCAADCSETISDTGDGGTGSGCNQSQGGLPAGLSLLFFAALVFIVRGRRMTGAAA